MTVEEAVRQRILDLGTSAGSRVYMLKVPQQLATWPAVRVQLIDDPGDYHLRGGSGLKRARVQVDCYAPESSGGDPYATVVTLADQIDGDDAGSGLSGFAGSIEDVTVTGLFRIDRRPMYEAGLGSGAASGGELRLVRMLLEYRAHYKN